MALSKPLSIALNSLLVLISALVGLAAMELLYRSYEPEGQRLHFSRTVAAIAENERLGWTNPPRKSYSRKTSAGQYDVHTNAEGMRYHEVGPKTRFRVAVIGDSFTWGQGVNVPYRYTDLIEQRLNVDMLNFGVNGYGLVQYYLNLDKVLSFDPDLVLIGFCLSNDFSENLNNYGHKHYRPYGVIEDGKLVIRGIPVPLEKTPRWPWMADYALGRLLYAAIPRMWEEWEDKPEGEHMKPAGVSLRKGIYEFDDDDPQMQHMVALGSLVLGEIKKRLDARHIPLVIYGVTTKNEWQMSLTHDNDIGIRLLERAAQEQGIRLVQPDNFWGPNDFIMEDGHWNTVGHERAAGDLLPVIQEYRDRANAKVAGQEPGGLPARSQ